MKYLSDIFIIAGEASGDLLGADLLKNLKIINKNITINGIGGEEMEKLPFFKSIFNINDISIMGFTEVIKNLFTIKKRIKTTINEIIKNKPKIVITIDSPSFNIRIIKKVKKILPETKFIHYVAPQVWAWKENRAKKIAKIFDILLCLFPFEPKYFEKYGLKCFIVGHPGIINVTGNKERFFKNYNLNQTEKIISFLPGTRKQMINKLIPIYKDVVTYIKNDNLKTKILIPTTYYLKNYINKLTKSWEIKPIIITDKQNRYDAYSASNIAIAISGTSILELALLKIPTIVVYKVSYLTYLIAKLFIKLKWVSLPNIIMNKQIITELIQNNCTPKNIINEIKNLNKENKIIKYKQDCNDLIKLLQNQNNENPSLKAAKIISKYLK